MNGTTLRLLARDPGGLGDVQVAVPSEGDERVVLWNGLPPAPVGRHPNVAPVVLEGEIEGRRAYAESVPPGVRPSIHPPPPELCGFVVAEMLLGLRHLHDAGEVHGAVGPDRIVLGTRGEVVLVGRGRQGGQARLDTVAALSLLPRDGETTLLEADVGELTTQVRRQSPPGARGLLAAWVRGLADEGRVVDEIRLEVGDPVDAVDEIVPDIGPDAASGGLLDHLAVTPTPGVTTGDVTAGEVTAGEVTATEATGDASTATDPAASVWSLLATPPERPPPVGRFDNVRGVPSAGVRALLDREGVDLSIGPLVGTVEPFVVANPRFEDQPTMVGPVITEPPIHRQKAPHPPRRVPWRLVFGLVAAGALTWVLWRFLL